MAAPRNRPAPRRRILDYLNIHPSELRPTLGLSLYLLLGIASVICLKTAANSLFLSQFDAKWLPYADLAITALVGLVVGFYLRLSNRVTEGRLILWTQAFLILNLLTLWYLLGQGVFGIPALLYVWVGIFTVLIPSQVWSLAGTIFDTPGETSVLGGRRWGHPGSGFRRAIRKPRRPAHRDGKYPAGDFGFRCRVEFDCFCLDRLVPEAVGSGIGRQRR